MAVEDLDRLDDVDLIAAPKLFVRSLPHDGIHMDRIDRAAFRMLIEHAADRTEHMMHRLAEVLAAVRRDEDQLSVAYPIQLRVRVVRAHRVLHRIDDRIARNEDRRGVLALAQKILRGELRRSKVKLADDADRLTVEFLGIRTVDVVGAQTRFDVTDGDLQIEAGKRSYKGRARISVDQNNIGLDLFKDSFDTAEDVRRDVKQRLLVLHNIQIVVRHDAEGRQDLVEHLTMLCRDADDRLQTFSFFQLVDQRAHFDCFRTCAENQHNLFHKRSPVRCGTLREGRRCCGSPARSCRRAFPSAL